MFHPTIQGTLITLENTHALSDFQECQEVFNKLIDLLAVFFCFSYTFVLRRGIIDCRGLQLL